MIYYDIVIWRVNPNYSPQCKLGTYFELLELASNLSTTNVYFIIIIIIIIYYIYIIILLGCPPFLT
jgi:hypothetical protein